MRIRDSLGAAGLRKPRTPIPGPSPGGRGVICGASPWGGKSRGDRGWRRFGLRVLSFGQMIELTDEIRGFVVAFAIGLLVGAERETRKGEGDVAIAAGVRTMVLIALGGALGATLGAVAFAVGGAFVALAAIAKFHAMRDEDPGLTTEVAMVVVYLLGAYATREYALAAGIGVVVALVLASKARVHGFLRETLTPEELNAALLLLGAAVVVLPMLPDRPIDPLEALNPRDIWKLVVLVMAINAVGYVALRAFGARYGLAVAGFTGGFVSSTATIGGMGSRARQTPKVEAGCITGAVLSNVATVIQLAIILGAIAPALLRALALPLAVTGAVALVYALAVGWRGLRQTAKDAGEIRTRPFEFKHALLFAAIVATILFVSAWIRELFGESSVIAATAAAGFADAHASSGSAADIFRREGIGLATAAWAVVAAFATNTVSKTIAAFGAGGLRFGLWLLPGLALMAAAFAATAWWSLGR